MARTRLTCIVSVLLTSSACLPASPGTDPREPLPGTPDVSAAPDASTGIDASRDRDAGPLAGADAASDIGHVADSGLVVDAAQPLDAGRVGDAGPFADSGGGSDVGHAADGGPALDAATAADAGRDPDAGISADGGTQPAPFTWTPLVPAANTQYFWVSSLTGKDALPNGTANDCKTRMAPCRTLAFARQKLQNGTPSWLMLEKGSVFHESLEDWSLSGASSTEPMVITAYGMGARPRLDTGNKPAFTKAAGTVRHLWIVGLHFKAHNRDPATCATNPDFTVRGSPIGNGLDGLNGFHWVADEHTATRDENILIEDCRFELYQGNMGFEAFDSVKQDFSRAAVIRNVRIRGNVSIDAYSYQYDWNTCSATDVDAVGLYVNNVDGLLIEGNVFAHNGGLLTTHDDPRVLPANCQTPRCCKAGGGACDSPKPFNQVPVRFNAHYRTRQFYVNTHNLNVVLSRNIVSEGEGAQLRGGGTFSDNFVFRTTRAFDLGVATYLTPGGTTGLIADNVFFGGADHPNPVVNKMGGPRGFGVEVTNVKSPGLAVRNNLFLHDNSAEAYGYAIRVSGANNNDLTATCKPDYGYYCRVQDVTLENNIAFNWRGGFQFIGEPSLAKTSPTPLDLMNIVVKGNILQNPGDSTANLIEHMQRCMYGATPNCPHAYPGFGTFTFTGQLYHRGGGPEWFQTNQDPQTAQWPGAGQAAKIAFRGQSLGTQGTFREHAQSVLSSLGIPVPSGQTPELVFLREAGKQSKDNWRPAFFAPVINASFRWWYTPCPVGQTKC